MTLEAGVTESVRVLEGLQGVAGPVARERLTLAVGEREQERYRMTITDPRGRRAAVAITQYMAVSEGSFCIVTLTTLPDQEAGYAQTFDGIGRSLRFLK
jgi:hypothetical protein